MCLYHYARDELFVRNEILCEFPLQELTLNQQMSRGGTLLFKKHESLIKWKNILVNVHRNQATMPVICNKKTLLSVSKPSQWKHQWSFASRITKQSEPELLAKGDEISILAIIFCRHLTQYVGIHGATIVQSCIFHWLNKIQKVCLSPRDAGFITAYRNY